MGAEAFVDFREVSSVAEEVKKVAGGIGAHGVIVTAPQAYKDAISFIGDRVGGKIVCVGLRKIIPFCISRLPLSEILAPKNTVTIGADPSYFSFRNLHVMGSLVGTVRLFVAHHTFQNLMLTVFRCKTHIARWNMLNGGFSSRSAKSDR